MCIRDRPITVRDLTAAILSEYEDVLSDELNPVPMQTGTDMHINLIDNVKPFKTLLARRVPLRYENEANKTIQDLIDKKVIVPVSETTVVRRSLFPKETGSESALSPTTPDLMTS